MLVALIRSVPSSIANAQLTYLPREPISVALATEQHNEYVKTLRRLGVETNRLPSLSGQPDSVFVEDTAFVLDEVAVIARSGAPSRRVEVQSVEPVLVDYRPLRFIDEPGTLDGGDVFQAERTVFVGLSTRTNEDGIKQLRRFVERYDYRVQPVEVTGALHLKSAATYLGKNTILVNRDLLDSSVFSGFDLLDVPADEPGAADTLVIGDTVLLPASFPHTRELLESHGYKVETVDVSELQKAEAGISCMSIIFTAMG